MPGPRPVIGTVSLLTDSGVLLIPDQPVKFGVTPQAQRPPALDGDVAAAGIEVP